MHVICRFSIGRLRDGSIGVYSVVEIQFYRLVEPNQNIPARYIDLGESNEDIPITNEICLIIFPRV